MVPSSASAKKNTKKEASSGLEIIVEGWSRAAGGVGGQHNGAKVRMIQRVTETRVKGARARLA